MLVNPFSINSASQELQGLLHGTTLNQIEDIYGVYRRAGSQLLLDLDPQETKVIALNWQITTKNSISMFLQMIS